jgi:dolichol-phosphate mannosyltransferase
LIVLSVASAIFLSPILALGVFGLTLAMYILLKYDSRLFVGTGIFTLILSAAFLASGSSAANETAIIAYYFLVIGVLGLLIEYFRKEKTTNGCIKTKARARFRCVPLEHFTVHSTRSITRVRALNGVSIVTTTWNERENIEKLILSIRKVLQGLVHEIIVVDDNSPDGTVQIAHRLADVAVTKIREGQSKGLLHGMQLAKHPIIITIDADLENNPDRIPELIQKIGEFDIVVACRTKLPRISETIASKTLGKIIGVADVFSNFRAYRKETIIEFNLRGGETFGAEFLVAAKKKRLRIGEIKYDPPPRRKRRKGYMYF